eukprot:scaffold156149_cov24-Tisochrysis_lutea.AAC.2
MRVLTSQSNDAAEIVEPLSASSRVERSSSSQTAWASRHVHAAESRSAVPSLLRMSAKTSGAS